MKIYRGGFTYGRAPLGPHASCVHEVSRYGVHARRVRSQAHTANGSASYLHRRHKESGVLGLEPRIGIRLYDYLIRTLLLGAGKRFHGGVEKSVSVRPMIGKYSHAA